MQGEVFVFHSEEIPICHLDRLIIRVTAVIIGAAFLFHWESSIERAVSAKENLLQPRALIKHCSQIIVVQAKHKHVNELSWQETRVREDRCHSIVLKSYFRFLDNSLQHFTILITVLLDVINALLFIQFLFVVGSDSPRKQWAISACKAHSRIQPLLNGLAIQTLTKAG